MATNGKIRGPKEDKYVKRASKDDPEFSNRKKRTEKQVGEKKK
jgi:hypothetical protein